MNNLSLYSCACCGRSTDARYPMTHQQDGSWTENTDGTSGDLLACYGCCDQLEAR